MVLSCHGLRFMVYGLPFTIYYLRDMNEQAFQTLEYGDLRALVRRHAQTEMGRARAEELAPLASVEEVRRGPRAAPGGAGGGAGGGRWAVGGLAAPPGGPARPAREGATHAPPAGLAPP